ncbi:MAG: hypothetical protein A2Y17_11715 [Clostridiales bacterium GWF2_38_85]|nr:MAG: hypothetical protein A2Y17_11715 [Clostridiales bacterium GWF2_38_85]HBL85369.1 hypothetical protein [Clostridiales bacterium]
MSLDMLCQLKTAGFDSVVLTSHFYPHKISLSNYYIEREKAIKKFVIALEGKSELPHIYLGCELYLTPQIFNYSDINGLCLNKTNYILTELPDSKGYSEQTYQYVCRLMNDFSVIPVLAHIERYDFLLDEKILNKFIDLGCLTQINLTSLTQHEYKKKLLHFIEKGYISSIGTDSHSAPIKCMEIEEALSFINKRLGSDAINDITYRSERILQITS